MVKEVMEDVLAKVYDYMKGSWLRSMVTDVGWCVISWT